MLIENQTTGVFRNKKYGLFPMSFNGCEIIAVHNALELSGREADIDELIHLFKRLHLMVWWGLWGSNVFALGKALHELGVPFRKIKLDMVHEDGIYITAFWNRGAPFYGIHTVVTHIAHGEPLTYNLYSNAGLMRKGPQEFAGRRFIVGYKLL